MIYILDWTFPSSDDISQLFRYKIPSFFRNEDLLFHWLLQLSHNAAVDLVAIQLKTLLHIDVRDSSKEYEVGILEVAYWEKKRAH